MVFQILFPEKIILEGMHLQLCLTAACAASYVLFLMCWPHQIRVRLCSRDTLQAELARLIRAKSLEPHFGYPRPKPSR